MNTRRITLSMGAVLVALALTLPMVLPFPVGGQSDGIIVDGADATTTLTVTTPSLTIDLEPRFVVCYANSIRYYDIAPPSNLPIQLDDRLVIWYANSNRIHTLTYPVGLVGDTMPPQITDITYSSDAADSVTIVWYTDEFADSTVHYGTQPGVYSETVSDPLYYKRHEVTLTGLTPGSTYYYQVSSTDRSGNTATSSEHSLTPVQYYIYLPLILRH